MKAIVKVGNQRVSRKMSVKRAAMVAEKLRQQDINARLVVV